MLLATYYIVYLSADDLLIQLYPKSCIHTDSWSRLYMTSLMTLWILSEILVWFLLKTYMKGEWESE